MKTIKETNPNIKQNTLLIDKDQQVFKVIYVFKYIIQVEKENKNIFLFNTTDIKQMKLKEFK